MDRYSDYYSDHDDDRSDLSALDFSSQSDDDQGADADALDFTSSAVGEEDAGAELLDEYTPVDVEDDTPDLSAIDPSADDETSDDDPLAQYRFTVTNPPETVSVSAVIGGRIEQIDLAPTASRMSETELADEIRVLAKLAQQKAMAGQTAYLMESDILADNMRQMGVDSRSVVRDFMENGMGFPTAEAAEAAQAEVFATRYARDDE